MPWAVSENLGDYKLFFGPKHNIYTFFMILFGLFDTIIFMSNLSFELWNRKLKIKEIYFKKWNYWRDEILKQEKRAQWLILYTSYDNNLWLQRHTYCKVAYIMTLEL